ncbi:MAG TPA: helix-turn-helix domain-containing protein [Anaerolineaceae bacterium]|nr:helix-turn-helix domain-containing protein [Anaerolineaceae bacterium]
MDSEFLTAEEVAEYLRLPLSTVYKLVQDKRLPGFKVGKHWRFRKDSIEKWIKDQERKNVLSDEVKYGNER